MTRIGRTLVITGELLGEEPITIDGHIDGRVSVRDATVTLGPHATVDGDVRGARVVVHGTVTGSVAATERIELHATGSVEGSLSANQVVIADGARFSGGIDMGQRTIAAKIAHYKASQPVPAAR